MQSLCSKGLLLNRGHLEHDGLVRDAIQRYISRIEGGSGVSFEAKPDRPTITLVRVDTEELKKGNLSVKVGFKSPFPLQPPVPGIIVSSALGTPVFGTNPRFHAEKYEKKALQEGIIRMQAPQVPLTSGQYHLSVYLGDWHTHYDQRLDICAFEFEEPERPSNRPPSELIGHLNWKCFWSVS